MSGRARVARVAWAVLLAGSLLLALGARPRLDTRAQADAGAQGLDDLRRPAPVADGITGELTRWQELDCARCHAEIAGEWARSRHALAWVDERYQAELADMQRPESCHGCHVPKPLHAQKLGQKPAARELADAHFGIRCESCHLAGESTPEAPVILGPFGARAAAHVSVKSPSFLPEGRSALCISCHATNIGPVIGVAKDFVETAQADKGKSCVGCHMQSLTRPIAREPGGPVLEPRAGRSHALQTPRDPAFLRRAFTLSSARRDGSVVVSIANACGHRVPGLIDREIVITAELLDAAGNPLAESSGHSKAERTIDMRSNLLVDGVLEIVLAGAGARVRVRGTHAAPGFEKPVDFLAETLEVTR